MHFLHIGRLSPMSYALLYETWMIVVYGTVCFQERRLDAASLTIAFYLRQRHVINFLVRKRRERDYLWTDYSFTTDKVVGILMDVIDCGMWGIYAGNATEFLFKREGKGCLNARRPMKILSKMM